MSARTLSDLHRHFKRRVYERYGLVLNREDIRQLEARIRSGRGKMFFRESLTRSHWNLRYKDTEFYVVYNNKAKALCTALTPEMAATKELG